MANRTTTNHTAGPTADQADAAEARAWLVRQVRWERRLAELHTEPGHQPQPGRPAALSKSTMSDVSVRKPGRVLVR